MIISDLTQVFDYQAHTPEEVRIKWARNSSLLQLHILPDKHMVCRAPFPSSHDNPGIKFKCIPLDQGGDDEIMMRGKSWPNKFGNPSYLFNTDNPCLELGVKNTWEVPLLRTGGEEWTYWVRQLLFKPMFTSPIHPAQNSHTHLLQTTGA